jgi:HK97 family phage prohead protease
MSVVHIRGADFELRDDGRTLTGCIVPYGVIADIAEMGDDNQIVRYREQFLPHSLAAMAQGFNSRGGKVSRESRCFVPLLLDHRDNFDSMIGHAVELTDQDDGAFASFRLYDDANITKIRSVLTESHTGLSIAFRDVKQPRMIDDVVSRVQVHVGHVAATPIPAYVGAGIESLRNAAGPVSETPLVNDIRQWLQSERQARATG